MPSLYHRWIQTMPTESDLAPTHYQGFYLLSYQTTHSNRYKGETNKQNPSFILLMFQVELENPPSEKKGVQTPSRMNINTNLIDIIPTSFSLSLSSAFAHCLTLQEREKEKEKKEERRERYFINNNNNMLYGL